MKEYTVRDLFHTRWEQINPTQMITVIELTDQMRHLEKGSREWGLVLISILRTVRKNKGLVGKLEVEQAVDCFNDLTGFMRNPDGTFATPWYFFPVAGFNMNGFQFNCPETTSLPLCYHSFEQLVYADSAFSAFCLLNYQYNRATEDIQRRQFLTDMEEALCSLIAVIFTAAEDFDIADMEVRGRLIPLKYNVGERALILHTYANIRKFITDRCPNLFPRPPIDDAREEPQAPTFTGPMWMNLRYDLAKTEVFKGFNVASKARIYDALDFLEKEAIEFNQRNKNGKA